MSISPKLIIPLILLITHLSPLTTSESDSDRVTELVHLRSQSPSGVIHLDDRTLARFLTSAKPPRPYSLLIFFDAVQLHDKQELHLKDLRFEFGLVASAFNRNNPSDTKLFFCDLEFKESQSSFSQFAVNALPHVRYVNPKAGIRESEPLDQADFARLAESMAEFVESKTGFTVGTIERPPLLSKNQVIFFGIVMLAMTPFLVKRILAGETLFHDFRLWLIFSVFVYFFSVSGSMHNIIRKMPMFISDRNDPSKMVFFYQGSGMQLGAEGFAVGFLYTIVGLLLAFVTHGLVYVRNPNVQRTCMIFTMVVSFWAVTKVIFLDNWKTGYSIHGFWPSSWN